MDSMSADERSVDLPFIDRAELQRRLGDPSLTILNVLPHEAYRAGRVPGSISLPFAEIPQRAREVVPDQTRDIVVYCASDT